MGCKCFILFYKTLMPKLATINHPAARAVHQEAVTELGKTEEGRQAAIRTAARLQRVALARQNTIAKQLPGLEKAVHAATDTEQRATAQRNYLSARMRFDRNEKIYQRAKDQLARANAM